MDPHSAHYQDLRHVSVDFVPKIIERKDMLFSFDRVTQIKCKCTPPIIFRVFLNIRSCWEIYNKEELAAFEFCMKTGHCCFLTLPPDAVRSPETMNSQTPSAVIILYCSVVVGNMYIIRMVVYHQTAGPSIRYITDGSSTHSNQYYNHQISAGRDNCRLSATISTVHKTIYNPKFGTRGP
jgi:hypothetical protein